MKQGRVVWVRVPPPAPLLLVFSKGVLGSNTVLTEKRMFELLQNYENRKVPCNDYGKRRFRRYP